MRRAAVSHADKGTAVTPRAPRWRRRVDVYFGDDVTDEDAFAAWPTDRHVTVKVGAGRDRRARSAWTAPQRRRLDAL